MPHEPHHHRPHGGACIHPNHPIITHALLEVLERLIGLRVHQPVLIDGQGARAPHLGAPALLCEEVKGPRQLSCAARRRANADSCKCVAIVAAMVVRGPDPQVNVLLESL